ncbi:MAG: membrane lipoprotein lipid attachment site-containing protein [Bacteroidota bacterium]
MKKIIFAIVCLAAFSSCSVFRKKEKYGCPGSPQGNELSTDQRIASGENVKQKKSRVKTGNVWKGN